MVWLIVPIYLASELWARDRRGEETRAIDGETEAPASGTATRGRVIWPVLLSGTAAVLKPSN